MFGIVIVGYKKLPEQFREAAEYLIGGKVKQMRTVCIPGGDFFDSEGMRKQMDEAVKAVNTGDGFLVLTDTAGGSVSTLMAHALSRHDKGDAICGINLAGLVSAIQHSNNGYSVKDSVEKIAKRAADAVQIVSKLGQLKAG